MVVSLLGWNRGEHVEHSRRGQDGLRECRERGVDVCVDSGSFGRGGEQGVEFGLVGATELGEFDELRGLQVREGLAAVDFEEVGHQSGQVGRRHGSSPIEVLARICRPSVVDSRNNVGRRVSTGPNTQDVQPGTGNIRTSTPVTEIRPFVTQRTRDDRQRLCRSGGGIVTRITVVVSGGDGHGQARGDGSVDGVVCCLGFTATEGHGADGAFVGALFGGEEGFLAVRGGVFGSPSRDQEVIT